MSELLRVELTDLNRLLKRVSWSSFSVCSGRVRLGGGGKASDGSVQWRGGKPEQWDLQLC